MEWERKTGMDERVDEMKKREKRAYKNAYKCHLADDKTCKFHNLNPDIRFAKLFLCVKLFIYFVFSCIDSVCVFPQFRFIVRLQLCFAVFLDVLFVMESLFGAYIRLCKAGLAARKADGLKVSIESEVT